LGFEVLGVIAFDPGLEDLEAGLVDLIDQVRA
jgi:hypothetical protein